MKNTLKANCINNQFPGGIQYEYWVVNQLRQPKSKIQKSNETNQKIIVNQIIIKIIVQTNNQTNHSSDKYSDKWPLTNKIP
jgi:hypothetical protein